MAEMFDILDENGVPTGEVISRSEAHLKGIRHGASHIFIYRYFEGKLQLLLQRRSANKDSFPNCLDISSAGHCEAGMGFMETALKEMSEELGLFVKEEDLKAIGRIAFDHCTEFYGKPFWNNEICEVYIYDGSNLDCSKLVLQQAEVSETLWMNIDEVIAKIKDENDNEICMKADEVMMVWEAVSCA